MYRYCLVRVGGGGVASFPGAQTPGNEARVGTVSDSSHCMYKHLMLQ